MNRFHNTSGIVRVLIVAGAVSLASRSEAILLNLNFDPSRVDATSTYIGVDYNAGTKLFQATGYTSGLTNSSASLDPATVYTLGISWTLTATITNNVTLGLGVLTAGSLTIQGDTVAGAPDTLVTLLTGTLATGLEGAAFGSTTDGNDEFEFLFTVTGGSLASDYGGIGAPGGVKLFPTTGSNFSSWDSSFSNDGFSGVADTVPEPSSLLLLVLAGTLCVATHRSRKRARVPLA